MKAIITVLLFSSHLIFAQNPGDFENRPYEVTSELAPGSSHPKVKKEKLFGKIKRIESEKNAVGVLVYYNADVLNHEEQLDQIVKNFSINGVIEPCDFSNVPVEFANFFNESLETNVFEVVDVSQIPSFTGCVGCDKVNSFWDTKYKLVIEMSINTTVNGSLKEDMGKEYFVGNYLVQVSMGYATEYLDGEKPYATKSNYAFNRYFGLYSKSKDGPKTDSEEWIGNEIYTVTKLEKFLEIENCSVISNIIMETSLPELEKLITKKITEK
jgi:hypothetical protein